MKYDEAHQANQVQQVDLAHEVNKVDEVHQVHPPDPIFKTQTKSTTKTDGRISEVPKKRNQRFTFIPVGVSSAFEVFV